MAQRPETQESSVGSQNTGHSEEPPELTLTYPTGDVAEPDVQYPSPCTIPPKLLRFRCLVPSPVLWERTSVDYYRFTQFRETADFMADRLAERPPPRGPSYELLRSGYATSHLPC